MSKRNETTVGGREAGASADVCCPGFWRRLSLPERLPYVLFGVLVVLAIALLGRELGHHLSALEAWISGLGSWGGLAFVVLFVVLTSVVVPDTALAIVAGALFGLGRGMGLVVLGGLLAAVVQYALARTFLRGRIERFLAARPGLEAIQHAVMKEQTRLQLLVRLTPLPPPLISYALGAAGVRLSGFVAALVGLLPAFFVEVYFGYAGRHLADIAGQPTPAVLMHDVVVLAGVAVTLVVMMLVARTARRAVVAAAAER